LNEGRSRRQNLFAWDFVSQGIVLQIQVPVIASNTFCIGTGVATAIANDIHYVCNNGHILNRTTNPKFNQVHHVPGIYRPS
jgi:hypothetical protein